MSTDYPIISDWSQLHGMDQLPARIVWERDGKEMAIVPPGAFTMGMTEEEAHRLAEEWEYAEGFLLSSTPLREVTLGAYYMDVTPVTHADYAQFIAANPQYRLPHVEEPWAQPYNWDKEKNSLPKNCWSIPLFS